MARLRAGSLPASSSNENRSEELVVNQRNVDPRGVGSETSPNQANDATDEENEENLSSDHVQSYDPSLPSGVAPRSIQDQDSGVAPRLPHKRNRVSHGSKTRLRLKERKRIQ